MDDPFNAFAAIDVTMNGSPSGPLSGLTFAAKDLYDIEGHVTGGGNPDWRRTHEPAARTAPAIEKLLAAGARLTGKTHTDELSRGIFGENAHYGTPINPRARDRLPGGSSSGSAAATAGGIVDFALGTDTGGSVRVPSSFCGLYGIRPTHDRLPFDGVMHQAPSFDTIGWLARDPELLATIGEILLDLKTDEAPEPQRLIVAEECFDFAEAATRAALAPTIEKVAAVFRHRETRPLSAATLADWHRHQTALQGREAMATFSDWIDLYNPRFGFEIADNFLSAARADDAAIAHAEEFRFERRRDIAEWLDGDTVVCLPTTPFPSPLRDQRRSVRKEQRGKVITLTSIAGMLGAPQINLPLANVDGLPVGLSLMAAPGNDAVLLTLVRRISQHV